MPHATHEMGGLRSQVRKLAQPLDDPAVMAIRPDQQRHERSAVDDDVSHPVRSRLDFHT
jgi:hypothetical protein